jgi:4-aminobutyrate aminotransferase-like enzyme
VRDRRAASPSYDGRYPFVMDHGRGSDVCDVDRNRYVDLSAGSGTAATGHSHPAIVRAGLDRASMLLEVAEPEFECALQTELGACLAEIGPMVGAKQVYLADSGKENVGLALRLASSQTSRPHVIDFSEIIDARIKDGLSGTCSNVYEGTGSSRTLAGTIHVPFSNPHHCPHGPRESECRESCICADYIEDADLPNAAMVGEILLDGLRAMQLRHPCTVRVEDQGLTAGAEFALDGLVCKNARRGHRPCFQDRRSSAQV